MAVQQVHHTHLESGIPSPLYLPVLGYYRAPTPSRSLAARIRIAPLTNGSGHSWTRSLAASHSTAIPSRIQPLIQRHSLPEPAPLITRCYRLPALIHGLSRPGQGYPWLIRSRPGINHGPTAAVIARLSSALGGNSLRPE
jgi:hypothetical protein